MVALRDVVDVNAEEPSRIRRLLAGEPIPVAPGVPTPPRGLGRMTLFVVGLAVVALVFSAALDPERRHAASAVIGVAAVITLALAALSVVVADAGRHAGVVK